MKKPLLAAYLAGGAYFAVQLPRKTDMTEWKPEQKVFLAGTVVFWPLWIPYFVYQELKGNKD